MGVVDLDAEPENHKHMGISMDMHSLLMIKQCQRFVVLSNRDTAIEWGKIGGNNLSPFLTSE